MGTPETFKTLFCEYHRCSAHEFEQQVFWRCVHRPALPIAFVIARLRPSFFREDFAFIRDAGSATSRQEVVGELNRFFGRNLRERNWLRRTFGIRVSAKRLLRLWKIVFRAKKHAKPPARSA